MAKAKTTNTTDEPGRDPGHLLALARQEAQRVTAVATLQRLRHEARAEIDRLIAFLDQSDEYVLTELEDDDDREDVGDREPSLGSFDRMVNQEKGWRAVGGADLDAELDTSDDEPSLGSLERSCCAAGWRDGANPTGDQTRWGDSPRNDLEDEHDGREPDESGIGDYDGVLEQIGTQDWQRGGMV